jgi:hypothetical protein
LAIAGWRLVESNHWVRYGSGSDRIQCSPPLGTVRERFYERAVKKKHRL